MLLEALIGLLIFSLGILSLVSLQATSISNVTDAKYRADATFLASQLIGQLWADKTNIVATAGSEYAYSGGTPPLKLDTWVDNVKTTLPGAGVSGTYPEVSMSTNANNQVVASITIKWKTPKSDLIREYHTTTYLGD